MIKTSLKPCAAALALSLPALAVQAQSSVQLYGMIDIGLGSFQRPEEQVVGGGVINDWKRTAKLDRNNEQTSYWGLRGKEVLSEDLSAVFLLESFFRPDTGELGRFNSDQMFTREAYAGLASKQFGELRLGRHTTHLFTTSFLYNPFGSGFGWSPTIRHIFSGNEGRVRGDSGWSNSIHYLSPKIAGFNLSVMAAAGEKDTGNGGLGVVEAQSFMLSYNAGAFSTTLTMQDVKVGAASTQGRSQVTGMLGASYDFGLLKLSAQYTEIADKPTGFEDRIVQVGVAVPLGRGKVLASYGQDDTDSTDDTTLKTLSLGYNLPLSKRTDITVVAMRETQEKGVALAPNANSLRNYGRFISGNSYGFGLRHRF